MLSQSAILQASRRCGLKVKLQIAPGGRRRTGLSQCNRAKLTIDQVRAIRSWSRREGYGLSVPDQVRHVRGHMYPALAEATIREILRNLSWHDPSYEPGSADEDFWRGHATTVSVLLHVLATTT